MLNCLLLYKCNFQVDQVRKYIAHLCHRVHRARHCVNVHSHAQFLISVTDSCRVCTSYTVHSATSRIRVKVIKIDIFVNLILNTFISAAVNDISPLADFAAFSTSRGFCFIHSSCLRLQYMYILISTSLPTQSCLCSSEATALISKRSYLASWIL